MVIGEAWKDNYGNYHIAHWSFEEGVNFEPEQLVNIAGDAGGFQGYCFFCLKPLKKKGILLGQEKLRSFHDMYADYPNNLEGRIGKKAVCTECINDMKLLTARE